MNSDIDPRAHKAQPPLSDKKAIPSEKRQFGSSFGYPRVAKSFEPKCRFRDDGTSNAGNSQMKPTEGSRDFRDRQQESYPFESLRRGAPNSNYKEHRNGELEVDPRNRRKYKNERDEFPQGRGTSRNTLNPPPTESLQGNNSMLSRNSPNRETPQSYRQTSKTSYPKPPHVSPYKQYSDKWSENPPSSRPSMKGNYRGERGTRNGSPRRMDMPSQGDHTVLPRGMPYGNSPLLAQESTRLQECAMGEAAARNNGAYSDSTVHSPQAALLPLGEGVLPLSSPPGDGIAGVRLSPPSLPLSVSPVEPVYTHVSAKVASQAGIIPAPLVFSPPVYSDREIFAPTASPVWVREAVETSYTELGSFPTPPSSRLSGSHSLGSRGSLSAASLPAQDASSRGLSTEMYPSVFMGKGTRVAASSRRDESRPFGKREAEPVSGGVEITSALFQKEEGSRLGDVSSHSTSSRSVQPVSPSVSAPLVSTREDFREEAGVRTAGASAASRKHRAAPLMNRKAESAPKLTLEQGADDGWSDDGDGFGGDVSMVDIVDLKSKSPPADTRLSIGVVDSGFTPRSTLSGVAHGVMQSVAAGISEEESSHFVNKTSSFTTSTSISSTLSQQRKVGTPLIPKDATMDMPLDLGPIGKKVEGGGTPPPSAGLVSSRQTQVCENVGKAMPSRLEDTCERETSPSGDCQGTEATVFVEEGKGIRTRVESDSSGSGKEEKLKNEQSLTESITPSSCTVSSRGTVLLPGETVSPVITEAAAIPSSPREGKASTVMSEDLADRDTPPSIPTFTGSVATLLSPTEEGDSSLKSAGGGVWRSSRRTVTRTEALARQVKGLLNKLTIEKFPTIIEKLATLEEEVRQEYELVELVNLVVGKAVLEPEWSEMYADLCIVLNWRSPSLSENPQNTFRVALISKIQEEFQRLPKTLELSEEEAQGLEKAAIDLEIKKMKNHILGVVRLIGELFQRRLLAFRIVSSVVVDLVIDNENPHEHVIECFLQLICTTGYHIDQIPTLKSALDLWFGRLKELQNKDRYSKRLKCVIQDVLDLRKAGWRRKIHRERAKALSAVRGQLEKEDCIGGATHAAQYGNIVVIGKPSNMDSSKSYGAYLEEQRQRFEMRKNQRA
ncbi:putative eukaryotic translation initiation factor [Cardiosporidium cionae]|uniref:Eukaryotic translation initiation factor n=1 Tax=Cardiosporidium cionae TaxID=476202 RepID=A0ABQ7J4P4_9APIC|nr:putative eukaryotic translation initiation factor [Cardiosporidium cionae]|eukprot:KAF8818757.1 putative eukaryotic translation initiation factor [Cardiosporidium cionae]